MCPPNTQRLNEKALRGTGYGVLPAVLPSLDVDVSTPQRPNAPTPTAQRTQFYILNSIFQYSGQVARRLADSFTIHLHDKAMGRRSFVPANQPDDPCFHTCL